MIIHTLYSNINTSKHKIPSYSQVHPQEQDWNKMSTRIPKLNSCCGVPLETATKAIGMLELVTNCIWILFYSFGRVAADEGRTLAFIELVISVFDACLAVAFLDGVYQKKRSIVRIWVIYKLFSSLFILLTDLYFGVGPTPISFLLFLVIRTYKILVVNSFYQEI